MKKIEEEKKEAEEKSKQIQAKLQDIKKEEKKFEIPQLDIVDLVLETASSPVK